jgi:hypothetical protein
MRVEVMVTTGEPGVHVSVAIGGAAYASLDAGRGMEATGTGLISICSVIWGSGWTYGKMTQSIG